jgi:hypothetical protein
MDIPQLPFRVADFLLKSGEKWAKSQTWRCDFSEELTVFVIYN